MNRTADPVEARKNRHEAAMRVVTGGIRGLPKPLQAGIVVSYSALVGAGGACGTPNRASIQSAAWSSCGGFGCLRVWSKGKSSKGWQRADGYGTSSSSVASVSPQNGNTSLTSARVGVVSSFRSAPGAIRRIVFTRTLIVCSPCCETTSAIRASSLSTSRTIPTCRNTAPSPRRPARTIRRCSSYSNRRQRQTSPACCGRVA